MSLVRPPKIIAKSKVINGSIYVQMSLVTKILSVQKAQLIYGNVLLLFDIEPSYLVYSLYSTWSIF